MASTSPNAEQRAPTSTLLRRLVRGHERRVTVVVVASLLSGLAQATVLVLIVALGVRLAAPATSQPSTGPLPNGVLESTGTAALTGLSLLAAIFILDVVASYASAQVSSRVLTSERLKTYDAFSNATWTMQAGERDGHLQELMSKNAGWTGTAVNSAANGLIAACSLIALGATALIAAPLASVGLALIGCVLVAVSRPMAVAARTRTAALSLLNVDLANLVARNIGLARDIRTFDVHEAIESDVTTIVETVSSKWVAIRVINRLSPSVFRTTALAVMLGAVWAFDQFAGANVAAIGTVVVLGLRCLGYGGAVQRSYQEIQNARPWIDQLWDRRATLENHRSDPGSLPLARIDELTFDNVGFRYRSDDDDDAEVLTSLNFTLRHGESIGVVGPSGAGKSTLVKLLLRLHDPESGDLLANGESAKTFHLSDWYDRVGYVPQDVATFNGTLADNIAFFRSDITRDQIITAATQAHLHEEIMEFPLGYDTLVGERMGRLSGGQKQRLALARALVGQPDVLVLDEPTSALDMRSEALVQQTIDELRGSMTIVVIAHRISTLSGCERIVVLENGKVTALGSPERVRARNEFFREAHRLSRR